MSGKYRIVNGRSMTYIDTETETFDGEWKERYPHTKGEEWLDVTAYKLWEHDMAEGLYFHYDLCRDGGMFVVFADADDNTPEQVTRAVEKIRRDRDVVSLRLMALTKATA